MPPSKHAVLSASSSHRWLNCSPSARLEQEFEDRETEAAAEGTAAHALCEHKLRRALKRQSRKPISKYDCEEMDTHTDNYVQFVLETIAQAKEHCADPIINIEQRLDFSCYVPHGFGTGDCIIIADKTLHIIDFKYGQGVLVEAEQNPQMMLYALGALRIYDTLYDIEDVAMTIYQPRRENISTWTITVSNLLSWAENELVPKAKLAFDGKGEYMPGPWCTFCKAAVNAAPGPRKSWHWLSTNSHSRLCSRMQKSKKFSASWMISPDGQMRSSPMLRTQPSITASSGTVTR